MEYSFIPVGSIQFFTLHPTVDCASFIETTVVFKCILKTKLYLIIHFCIYLKLLKTNTYE